MNRTNIYIIGKFDQSRYPTPSLNQKNQILCLKKLDNKELYNIQLLINFLTPTWQGYFENVFAGHLVEWTTIYISPRIVTTDSIIRLFQFKILHNLLYLSKKLFQFDKISSLECSFCKCEEETTIHQDRRHTLKNGGTMV